MRCVNFSRSQEALVGGRGLNYQPFPCGQCLACRLNRRRAWTARIMLETLAHPVGQSWVTLTYDPEHLPGDGGVDPAHIRGFLKALARRESWSRYFAVGEYGDRTGRPHYHLLLFGRVPRFTFRNGRLFDGAVEDAWRFGGTYTEDFACSENPIARAGYLASYAAKKWTRECPDGRRPEFARMSRRPGIGASAVPLLAGADISLPHVPRTVRIAGRVLPLDRYMRDKFSEATGLAHGPCEASEPLSLEELGTVGRRLRKKKDYKARRSAF